MVPLYPKSGINTVSPTVCNRPSIRRYSVDGGMITTIMKKNENFGRGPVKRMCNHIRNVKIMRLSIFFPYIDLIYGTDLLKCIFLGRCV